jgi:prepilin peptidase CpaA
MYGPLATVFLGILAALLLYAAVGDLRTREIPNPLNAAIALLAIPFWWALGLPLWPDVVIQIGVALGVFFIFALLFQLGYMGGGDVKMLSALALWLPLGGVISLVIIMSIVGGLLTLVTMGHHRRTKREGPIEVPYGVAIALAGLWVIGEPMAQALA